LGTDFTIVGGGKGANAAVAAARMGASVAFVGCLGEDDFGRARLADLDHEGIDTTLVRRSGMASSGVALIVVDAAGENTIVVVSGTNALLGPEDVAALTFAAGDVLLTQLELPLPTVGAALRKARDAGAATILNAAPYNPAVLEFLPLVDFLVLNEVEGADLLAWESVTAESAPEAIGAILARGVCAVALTLGARGAFVGQGEERRHFPSPSVTVVDTTAAGDAFTGALAAGLAAGTDLFTAAERAVIVGSLTVTKAGAQPSLPYLTDLSRES
jgi:ribokinase